MNEIPEISDKVKALRLYLNANTNDNEGDSWIFGHYPKITKFLDSFTLEDYRKLNIEIGKWEDRVLGNLADPVSETSNKIIDGSYVYCKIFKQINNIDELEYLIQNLAYHVWSIKGKYPITFYNELLKKTKIINITLKNNYAYTVEQIKKKKLVENNA